MTAPKELEWRSGATEDEPQAEPLRRAAYNGPDPNNKWLPGDKVGPWMNPPYQPVQPGTYGWNPQQPGVPQQPGYYPGVPGNPYTVGQPAAPGDPRYPIPRPAAPTAPTDGNGQVHDPRDSHSLLHADLRLPIFLGSVLVAMATKRPSIAVFGALVALLEEPIKEAIERPFIHH